MIKKEKGNTCKKWENAARGA